MAAHLATRVQSLPRELQLCIIRKLDIDSRRALGIYSKFLTPPPELSKNIQQTFFKVQHSIFASTLPIGPVRGTNRIQKHAYHIIKAFGGWSDAYLSYRVDYIPADFPPASLVIYLLDD